jgi:hypothetical protein
MISMRQVLARNAYLVLFLGLTALAAATAAPALDGWRLALAGDDPAARSDVLLDRKLTPKTFSSGLDAALDAGDVDLAESFVELGRQRGLAPGEGQRAQLEGLRRQEGENAIRDFGHGFVSGERDTSASFAGALAGDLSGYGDLRDLWNEGRKVAQGEKADELVVGLAAVGLALSAATLTSVGAALPARAGLTLVKSAQKTGRLTRPLAAALGRVAARTLDREALATTFSAAARLDLAASRAAAGRIIASGGAAYFRALGRDAAVIYRRAGARGVTQALSLAESGAEMRQAARLAAARGAGTRAVLATLGRAALLTGTLAAAAVNAMLAFVACFFGLAIFARRFGFWLGRLTFSSRRTGRSPATAFQAP